MGVTKKITKNGDGKTFPKKGDRLTMHYVGTLKKGGKKFDSSRDKGRPFNFIIGKGQVIKGWDEGVMTMSLGEQATLDITSDFAYGKRAIGGDLIPANSDLMFDVELLAITPPPTSGFQLATIKPGDGKTFPQKGDKLTMHYVGTLWEKPKKEFDSSRKRGKPFSFTIGKGQVIQGWDEGVMKMSKGERAKLTIRYDYGYGANGAGDAIPPNAHLDFDVELLDITKPLPKLKKGTINVVTLQAGDGKNYPKAGDMLTMHYTGTLRSDGSKFDSSVDKGRPFKFNIGKGKVIKGWDEGVMKMSLGEKARLEIASDKAYGRRAIGGGLIPANSDLHFDVQLLAIGDRKAATE